MHPTDDKLHRAVFLDRDGTINVEKDYLYKVEEFDFISGAQSAIKKLRDAGFRVIVVTNQSGIARGYYSHDDVLRLHEHIQDELAKFDTSIDAFYVCPHHPTAGSGDFRVACACRKPQPGLLLQAAEEWKLDLERSYIVGDKIADIAAGKAAGCTSILVKTGYGEQEIGKLKGEDYSIFNNIAEAADCILQNAKQQ